MKKLIALLTALCFSWSILAGNINVYAASVINDMGSIDIEKYTEIAIDGSVGKITEGFVFPGSKQLVINIQDLHCEPTVQRNISGVLSDINKKYGLKNIYVEGAYDGISTDWLCDFENETVKKDIMEELLNSGRLTGSEYFSILENKPDLIFGIEDKDVHQANIIRLGKLLDRQEQYKIEIAKLNKELAMMQLKYFNSKNKELNNIIKDYRNDKINTKKYYSRLIKFIEHINKNTDINNSVYAIDINKYPNFKKHVYLISSADKLNHRRISQQLSAFIKELKEKLPYGAYKELAEKTNNFSKLNDLYLYVPYIINNYDISLNNKYFELQKYFDYTKKERELNILALLEEEKELIAKIRTGLAEDINELEISFLSDFYPYFKDYMAASITADDYRYFIDKVSEFKTLWNKYTVESAIKSISDDFAYISNYYDINFQRDIIFKDKLNLKANAISASPQNILSLSQKEISAILKNADLKVIITGGFHSDGLKEQMFRDNISYIAVMPNINAYNDPEEIYNELVKKQAELFSGQALALTLGSYNASITVENNIVKVDINGENIELALNENTGNYEIVENMPVSEESAKKPVLTETVKENILINFNNIRSLSCPVESAGIIYALIETATEFGVDKGLFIGNGLIWEIASNKDLQEIIKESKGSSLNEIALLPDFIQKAISIKALGDMRSEIKDKPILSALSQTPEFSSLIEILSQSNNTEKINIKEITEKIISVFLPSITEYNYSRKDINSVSSISEEISKGKMTTGETLENYLNNHPFIKRLAEKENTKWLAAAAASLSLGKFGAVRAEMDMIVNAIILKFGGDEKLYQDFINAHPQKAREGVSKNLARMVKVIGLLMPTDAGRAISGPRMGAIKLAVGTMHWTYNFISFLFDIAGNIGSGSFVKNTVYKSKEILKRAASAFSQGSKRAIKHILPIFMSFVLVLSLISCNMQSEQNDQTPPSTHETVPSIPEGAIKSNDYIRNIAIEFMQGKPLPRSFIGELSEEVRDINQKRIAEEGLVIYDAAVLIKALLLYPEENKDLIDLMVKALEKNPNLRSNRDFDYDGTKILQGDGYYWKIISTNGKWLEGQSLPLTGENAWLASAMANVYEAYKGTETGDYAYDILLDITEAMLALQTENGLIKMAPRDRRSNYEYAGVDYNITVSVENNISAIPVLRYMSENGPESERARYAQALEDLEKGLLSMYDREGRYFYTGYDVMYGGINRKFATDCQTWMILAMGAEHFDELMKEEYGINNAGLELLKSTLQKSGVMRDGKYIGVDFSDRASVVSFEWSIGFLIASKQVLAKTPDAELQSAVNSIEKYIEENLTEDGLLPYADTESMTTTGHGWNINNDMLSLASSSWHIFLILESNNISPFDIYIKDKVLREFYSGEEIKLPLYVELTNIFERDKKEESLPSPTSSGQTSNTIRVEYDKESILDIEGTDILLKIIYEDGTVSALSNNEKIAKANNGDVLENKGEYYEGKTSKTVAVKEILIDDGQTKGYLKDIKDGGNTFNDINVSLMTTEETLENYLNNHPFIKRLAEKENTKWLAAAAASLSLGKFGAVRAEMDMIVNAIILKFGGDEKLYQDFINAHPQKAREGVSKNLARMVKVIGLLMPTDAGRAISGPRMGAIKLAVGTMHWIYNFFASISVKNILQRTFETIPSLSKKEIKEISVNLQNISNEDILNKAIEKFGAATMDSQGNTYTNIYFMGMPSDPESLGLQNMGWTVDGEFVWASAQKGALIIFSNASSQKVIDEFNNIISDKGNIKSSSKTIEKIKDLSREIDINADFNAMVPGIIIDHGTKDNVGIYNEQGSLIVSADTLGETKKDISENLSYLAEIRTVEANAMAKETYIYIDGADINMFKAYLGAFTSIGNNQMIVDFKVFENLSDKQITEVLMLAKNNGISISANISSEDIDKFSKNYFRDLGFANYMITSNGKMHKYNYFSSESKEIALIEGYKNESELVERIRKSDKNTAVKISELESLVNGGIRSIVDRMSILETFKSAILKLRNGKIINAEYAANAGYSWDINKLPEMPKDKTALLKAYKERNIELIVEEMGLAGNNAITMYLNQMSASIEDTAKLNEVQYAFIQALIERALANAALQERDIKDGLVNEDFEKLLGQKLLISLVENTSSYGIPIDIDNFIKSGHGTFNDLNNLILEQSTINTPQSINATIELILLSEYKVKEIRITKTPSLNVASVNAILKAA